MNPVFPGIRPVGHLAGQVSQNRIALTAPFQILPPHVVVVNDLAEGADQPPVPLLGSQFLRMDEQPVGFLPCQPFPEAENQDPHKKRCDGDKHTGKANGPPDMGQIMDVIRKIQIHTNNGDRASVACLGGGHCSQEGAKLVGVWFFADIACSLPERFQLRAVLLRGPALVIFHEPRGFHLAVESQSIRSRGGIQDKIEPAIFFNEGIEIGDFWNPAMELDHGFQRPQILGSAFLRGVRQFLVQIPVHKTRRRLRHPQQVAPDGLLLDRERLRG